MKLFNSGGEFFALDIGTTSVRVVQLAQSGKDWSLQHYGVAPVDIKVASSDAPEDQRKLGEVIMTVIGQSGIKARDVVLGIPSNKMFATVVDMPEMSQAELAATIRYQAEQFIPMSLDEAKVDWALLGKSPNDATKNEVLLASVANNFSEARLDLIEGLGFNVIVIEPDSLALSRALLPAGDTGAHLIIEVGDFTSDIVMTYNDSPRLIRSVSTGMQSFIKVAAQNLNVQPQQAAQFIMKFGMQPDKLEGQVVRALESSVDQFIAEIVKSVKFFQTRYQSITLNSMILSSYGATIPGFSAYVAERVGLKAEQGNPWQRVRVSTADQTKLQPLSAQFAVAVGLAQRGGDV